MSRGFVKEDDQEEAPLIPPRAALPESATNYVTPDGYELLLSEKMELEHARKGNQQPNETERRRLNMLIDGKLRLLEERIASARILEPKDQPKDEVRFGATVNFKNLSGPLKGKSMQLKVVGVDEADVKQQKIAFVSPLAKAAMGKRLGELVELHLGTEKRMLEVKSINYT
jgi:transcription elongation factor GreB